MITKNKHSKQSKSTIPLAEPYCYVIKYVAEGPEREDFYQDAEDGSSSFSNLSEATLFRSLQSAQRTATALNRNHPFDPQAHAVLKVQYSSTSLL
jgi:hypothetical protein